MKVDPLGPSILQNLDSTYLSTTTFNNVFQGPNLLVFWGPSVIKIFPQSCISFTIYYQLSIIQIFRFKVPIFEGSGGLQEPLYTLVFVYFQYTPDIILSIWGTPWVQDTIFEHNFLVSGFICKGCGNKLLFFFGDRPIKCNFAK